MKKTLTSILLSGAFFAAHSQTTFQNTTDLSGNEFGNMMELYGGVLNITGTTDATAGAGYDALVMQTDLLGNTTGNIHAGGLLTEYGTASYMSATGEQTIAGRSTSFSTSPAGLEDLMVVRLNASGNPIFLSVLGTDSVDYASAVKAANDGNIVVAGRVKNNTGGKLDGLLVKMDATNGNVLWSQNIGTPYANEAIYDVKSLGTGNGYLVAGYSGVNTIGLNEAMFSKLDDNGAMQGTFLLGGTGDDDARLIMDGPSNKFFLLGNTRSFGAGLGDIFVARFDVSTGFPTLDWFNTYGGAGEDAVTSAVVDGNGGLVITGITTSFGSGGDALAFGMDSNGAILWSKNYGGTGNDAFQNIISNGNGGYFVLGYTNSSPSTNNDMWLLEMSSTGATGCNENNAALLTSTAAATLISPPTAPTTDFVSAPITLINRNAGPNINTGTNTPVFNSMCLTTSIAENELSTVKIYPNPTSGSLNFNFGTNASSVSDIEIYNAMGEMIYKTKPGNGEELFTMDMGFLANGLYTVVVNEKDKKQVSRISVVK